MKKPQTNVESILSVYPFVLSVLPIVLTSCACFNRLRKDLTHDDT